MKKSNGWRHFILSTQSHHLFPVVSIVDQRVVFCASCVHFFEWRGHEEKKKKEEKSFAEDALWCEWVGVTSGHGVTGGLNASLNCDDNP